MGGEVKSFADIAKIDVSKYVEKKGRFSYLSWAWAVDQILRIDPKATWVNRPQQTFPDGTMMVYCDVTVNDVMRSAFLPVMDHQNKAIKNPNAFAINKAMQRCLAKGIALHGLGLYIYNGEDLPFDDTPETPPELITETQVADIEALAAEVGADMVQFLKWLGVHSLPDLYASNYDKAIKALEAKRNN